MPRMSCLLVAMFTPVLLVAVDEPITLPLVDEINGIPVPASPADPEHHSGHRLYRLPTFTHWPAIVYRDEPRNAAFHLPVPPRFEKFDKHMPRPVGEPTDPRATVGWVSGDQGTIGWVDGPQRPIELPDSPEIRRTSGLLDLPREPGLHHAQVTIEAGQYLMPLRIVDRGDPWPLDRLDNGFPVDREGVPVVLRDSRIDPGQRRSWAMLRDPPPRPTGPALVVGDPLAAPDGDVFADLDRTQVEVREATDQRYPHHAALVALAGFGETDPLPRTILYSPGNAAVHAGVWSEEASRVLDLVRNRCEDLGQLPRLILLLPPWPVDEDLYEPMLERRTVLRQRAAYVGWEVLDAADVLMGIAEPNRFADGLYTRYPTGAARARLAAAIASALAD